MSTSWRPPLDVFGLPEGASSPARAALQIAPPDVIQAMGGGLVFSSDTFEPGEADGEVEPVPGGLYAEETFGPLPRTAEGGADLAACALERFTQRPQIRRAGEITLATAVLHPWLRRFALPRVSASAGVAVEVVEDLLEGRLAVDPEGRIVTVMEHPGALARDFHVGVGAVAELARRNGAVLEGRLRRLPVLPAGLRPASRRGAQLVFRDPTLLYQRVLQVDVALSEDLDDADAPLAQRARRVVQLQRQVEALLLDGTDAAGHPAPPGKAVIKPLAHGLTGTFGARCLDDLAAADSPEALVLALRGPLFLWRAYVEASCLEIVPLRADGTVDEAARAKSWIDRASGTFDDVYSEQLGPSWRGHVMHGPDAGPPHVDVYSFDPRAPDEPARIVTAGASTVPLLAALRDGDPYIELVTLVPPGLDAERREGMMRALLALARFPFLHRTFLAGGHDVDIGRPVVPGSALSAWVLFDLDEDWTARLSDALPRHPRFLHAVAVTAAERAFKIANGSNALRERLRAEGAWVSDPRRG